MTTWGVYGAGLYDVQAPPGGAAIQELFNKGARLVAAERRRPSSRLSLAAPWLQGLLLAEPCLQGPPPACSSRLPLVEPRLW